MPIEVIARTVQKLYSVYGIGNRPGFIRIKIFCSINTDSTGAIGSANFLSIDTKSSPVVDANAPDQLTSTEVPVSYKGQ